MARGGFPGGFGGANMNNLMKQAQKLQRDMEQAQKELESKEFEASVGGGAVVVIKAIYYVDYCRIFIFAS